MPFKWTLMVFLAGDNNLSEECIYALNEMKKVGSTAQVAVIVELDTTVHESTRLKIEKGDSPGQLVRELNQSRLESAKDIKNKIRRLAASKSEEAAVAKS